MKYLITYGSIQKKVKAKSKEEAIVFIDSVTNNESVID